jgi:hypothetical protein
VIDTKAVLTRFFVSCAEMGHPSRENGTLGRFRCWGRKPRAAAAARQKFAVAIFRIL